MLYVDYLVEFDVIFVADGKVTINDELFDFSRILLNN